MGQAAAGDVAHYVRTTEPITLSDGSRVPVGTYVNVRYDAGDGWITYSESVYPKIKKTSAALLDAVSFDPPINGTANKLTGVYDIVPFRGGLLFAGIPRPSSTGQVIGKGEAVKIYSRTGEFYYVSTKRIRFALVPVAMITVSSFALQNGQSVPVPPTPSGGTAATTTRPSPVQGRLYGKLKIPFTLAGKVLPVDSYVTIDYEEGDYWLLFGSFGNPAQISKEAVEIVDKVLYSPPLTGTMKSPTMVYKAMPDVNRYPTTLEQSEAFANLNPSVRPGDEIFIFAREGEDYLIQIGRRQGRVPISAVNITYGDPNNGAPVSVPPRPQTTNAQAPGYRPPPPKPSDPMDYIIPFIVLSVVVGIAGTIYSRIVNTSVIAPGEADYGVPHANYKRTDDGFRVVFTKNSEAFYRVTHAWSNLQHNSGGVLGALMFLAMMILLFFVVILWYGIECFFKTTIVVDREAVTINGKKMARGDFGNFTIHHTLKANDNEVAVLGYQFGRRSFQFGGVWSHGHAQEVAGALNSRLRYARSAVDEQRASPENLRAARPTDF
jgi:hypothetical protein